MRALLYYMVPRFKPHEIAIISVLFMPITMPLLDFGSLGLLFALVGHQLRHQRNVVTAGLLVLGFALQLLWSSLVVIPDMVAAKVVVLVTLLALTAAVLWRTDYLAPIRFMPRATAMLSASALYYYVGHKIILEVITLL